MMSAAGQFITLSFLFFLSSLALGLDKNDPKAIIENLDKLFRSNSSWAKNEMQIITPHWERTLTLEMWSKGDDNTFIRIESPKKEKGTATLRIGDEMWNYLPKTNKVIKIPPSMMMGSWMGSDFNNDDLVSQTSLIDDYSQEFVTPDDAKEGHIYIELIPREDLATVWGKIVVELRDSDFLPTEEKYYDESGKLQRVMLFDDIKEMGGKTIPTKLTIIPQNKEGNKTIVKYIDAKFNQSIEDNIFSQRNLQRGY